MNALEKEPKNVYLLAQMANTLWNLDKDDEALSYALKGEEIDANDGLLAFTTGRILWSLERYQESILRWDRILTMDIQELSDIGFGRRWTLSLQNDARYYKADCLYHLHRDALAEALLKEHLVNRKRGQESDFTMNNVKTFLKILQYSSKDESVQEDYTTGYFTSKAQGDRVERHIDKLAKEKQWPTLIRFLKRKCKEFPKEYWLKSRLSEFLYDLGEKSCLSYAKEAYTIAPDDMLVVYDYACALILNDHYAEAISSLRSIQEKGLDYIAYSEHGEGMRWAKSLMKDTESLLSEVLELV